MFVELDFNILLETLYPEIVTCILIFSSENPKPFISSIYPFYDPIFDDNLLIVGIIFP